MALQTFPPEVFFLVTSHLDAYSALMLRGTCRQFCGIIAQDSIWNVNSLFRRFFRDPWMFRQKLRQVEGIVAGGLPTQFFARERWSESDLDVFVAYPGFKQSRGLFGDHRYRMMEADIRRRVKILGSFFVDHEGYRFSGRGDTESQAGDDEESSLGSKIPDYLSEREKSLVETEDEGSPLFTVCPFANGHLVVKIILFRGTWKYMGFVRAMLETFYGTQVMNFITWNQAVSVFPRLTFVERKMVVLRLPLYQIEKDGVQKYVSRGWRDLTLKGQAERQVGDSQSWVFEFDCDGDLVLRGRDEIIASFNEVLFLMEDKDIAVLKY